MELTVEKVAGNDKSMEETKELRNEKGTTEKTEECSSKPNRKFVPRPPKKGQIKHQIMSNLVRTLASMPVETTSTTGARSEQESNEPQLPDKWCIYRVPKKLRKTNDAAYTPQLLSIGPLHHGKSELKDMETYKKMYYENFCKRCTNTKDELKGFIGDRKKNILHCYAGPTELVYNIVDVILVDACFIIQLFLLNFEKSSDDYILRSEWLRKAVEHELILFENQLPYSLLEELYKFAKPAASPSLHPVKESQEQKVEGNESSRDNQQYSSCSTSPREHTISIDQSGKQDEPEPTFLKLTCEFFEDYSQGNSPGNGVKPKHFTDLLRHFLCPEEMKFQEKDAPVKSKYDVRKLTAAGVKFRPLHEGTVQYVIKRDSDEAHKCKFNLPCFRNMKLKLTQFCVKYDTECVIRNVMALEQILYPREPYICSYFLLMDQLVDTVEDVDLLVEEQIIVNLLGSNKAVMKLVNSLCEQIKEDKSCYSDLCVELNKHYEISKVNRSVAILKRVYFKDLWTSSSTVLGVVVLLFSVVGTIKSLMS
ncbi:PREDICTED: UPF0481 protein At3g47200-like [Prunus mume]|uniref:UPF0481 protein At3g47200-like n=1 Tax=Prunus mume TaxID=102107 RepID=A0ABM0P016_PRUMU|nr:PREDICTED: UPF0481 protein At3g47200-like [Prunus mume]